MKNTAIFSGVALAVLALALAPASAQSIDLLGGSDSGGATVSLGGGGSSGGTSTGADVDLGGSGVLGGGGNGGGVLNLGLGEDGDELNIIDFNGDGILDLNNGDVLDLNGNGIVDGNEGVGVGLNGIGEDGETQLAIGGEADDEVLVNLFGAPGDADGADLAGADILPNGLDNPVDEGDAARVNLLGGDDGTGETEAVVSLFGAGEDDASADADLLGGEGAAGDNAVALSLFGEDGDDGAATGGGAGGNDGDVADTGGTGGGGDDGDDTDPTQTGSIDDDDGGVGAGGGGNGNATVPGRPRVTQPATRVAAVGDVQADANCFTPDQTQIEHLLGRTSYDASVTASWSEAAKVSLVPVNLCPDARARLEAAIAANPNMDDLQNAVEASATITATLEPQFQADDVLAVDQSGEAVTVYVY